MALLLTLMLLPCSLLAGEDNVHVKGHWIFEIYNADGSFDRRVEFDNALSSFGNEILIRMLNRENSAAAWVIVLASPVGGGYEHPCTDASGAETTCTIPETSVISGGSPAEFPNLVVGTDNPTAPTKLVLSGSATIGAVVNSSKQIQAVRTGLNRCPNWENGVCISSLTGATTFTEKILNPAIDVQPGQIVNVTVEISFS